MKNKKWISLLLAGMMAVGTMSGMAVSASEAESTAPAAAGETAEAPVVDSVEEAVEVLGVEETAPAADVTVSVDSENNAAVTTAPAEEAVSTETTAATTVERAEVTTVAAVQAEAIQTTVMTGNAQGVAPTNYFDDVVLMLDVSGSMSGEPMEAMKDAAVGVCEKFLKADPKTVISVVAFGTNVQSLRYSSDFTSLAAYIRSLKAYGMTNMSGGMEEVKLILNGSNGKQKSVIIMADGMPNEGGHSYDADYGYDGYQNYALNYDNNNLKTAATVYSIGFFDSYYSKMDEQFIRDLASDPKYGYIVEDAKDLDGVFNMIFQNIAISSGKTSVPTATPTTDTSSSPKTGDAGVGVIVSVMALAVCGLALSRARRK